MKIPVAVLGCTGLVGRKMVAILQGHPMLELAELRASGKSAGMEMDGIKVKGLGERVESAIVLSALPSELAKEVERQLASEGKIVITKASAHRMDEDVPLIIPEVNPDHLRLLEAQKKNGRQGVIIADPNCTTTGLVLALKPIVDAADVESVFVVTMQALSGAGANGVAALGVIDNIIPHIAGEEEKIIEETRKILGKVDVNSERIEHAGLKIAAACHRVPVIDGHLETLHVRAKEKIDVEELKEKIRKFKGIPQELGLPSAPERPLILPDGEDRPQPRLDRMNGNGMSVTIGRIRHGLDERSVVLEVLSHNLIRGAAGASVLDAELLVATGKMKEIMEAMM